MSAGRPSREVAHRLFAVEFDDATVSLTESEDDMAPSYVVTATGALVNRAFVVGTLTSVDQVGDDIYRGRVADPTDTFVTYAGQYQPSPANFLADATPPAIVALTGKARTFQPDGSDDVLSSLRPERIVETTPATRDHWVLETARHTLGRVELMARVRDAGVAADDVAEALDDVPPHVATGIQRAIEHYDPSAAYLVAIHNRAVEALEVVAGERDAVAPLTIDPDESDPEASYADLAEGGFVEGWLGADVSVDAPARAAPEAAAGGAGPVDEPVDPPTTPDADDQPAPEPADDADTGGTDDLYELSDAEREEVEAEYGVDFATGDELDQTVDDELEDAVEREEPSPPADDSTPNQADDAPLTDTPPAEDDTAADDDTGADDLEDVVVEHMRELDGGNGVDRQDLIGAVTDATGADASAIDDAIQDALMSGSCYEPTEGRLKPI